MAAFMPVRLWAEAGKTSLSGIITDKATSEAIPGVTVYIDEFKTGAVTDISGHYRIDNLPLRKVLVQVRYVGYNTIIESVDLTNTTEQNFTLEEAVTEVTQVVVTGTSKQTELRQSPIPIAIIDKHYLEQNQGTNIIDMLAKVPGVNAVSTGPNVSKPFIRGLGYNRILTLYDGNRHEGQQWGDEHGIEVDEYSIDRIEILKGPASLTYGSDALGGVVNLLPAQPAPNGHILGSLLTNYQTNNCLTGTSGMLSGNHNGFVWLMRGSFKAAIDYQNKIDGRVFNTGFRERDASGYIGLNRSWGYSHLAFTLYDNLQEIPDGSRDSVTRQFTRQISEEDTTRPIVAEEDLDSYAINDIRQRVQHYRVYSVNNILTGKSKITFNLGYQRSVRREYSHPVRNDIPGLYLVLQTATYDIKYYFPERKGWDVTIGINGMYQDNYNKGTNFIIPDYHLFDAGPFVYVLKAIGNVRLSGGVRYDVRSFSNDAMYTATDPETGFDGMIVPPDTAGASQPFYAYQKVFHGFSGSLGVSWLVNKKLTLKANVARGYRSPNIIEISANGVHPGTNIYQQGKKAFKPEFSVQEDIGLAYTSEHVQLNVELFNNNISNYIYNQKLLNSFGQDSVIVPGNETFQFQQTAAHLFGGEISLDLHPHPLDWLHFENGLSVVYGFNRGAKGVAATDSTRYLPFIPPLHGYSELRADIDKQYAVFKHIYIKAGIEYYASQNNIFSAYGTETPTPGYVLFNAGLGTDITNKAGKTLLKLAVAANNLLDKAYQSHLSRLKYFEDYSSSPNGPSGIYNMGRNISIRLEMPLDFRVGKK
jgi:iron complex outermembrane receptor protein